RASRFREFPLKIVDNRRSPPNDGRNRAARLNLSVYYQSLSNNQIDAPDEGTVQSRAPSTANQSGIMDMNLASPNTAAALPVCFAGVAQ
ncbi:hypothetical protein, partial [Pseudomonas sp.]|uniref:hypothetical protein n=1 Tax=Pseudomonas sp. TaxID=306 RepID=UPI0028ADE724